MHPVTLSAVILFVLQILLLGGTILRILLRPHRQAASRIAWIVVVLVRAVYVGVSGLPSAGRNQYR